MKYMKRLTGILCLLAGIAITGFALWSLAGLDSYSLGKFSAAGRDTGTGIVLTLVGIALAFNGLVWIGQARISDSSTDP